MFTATNNDLTWIFFSLPFLQFNGFCTVLFSASSFATITCIAIDRYLSVVWSTRFPPSHSRACVMVVGIWVFSASYATLPLVNFLSSFSYLDATHHCSPVWENCFFYVVGFMTNYVITIPIMFVCYLFVFRIIWKKEKKLSKYRSAAMNLTYSQVSQYGSTIIKLRYLGFTYISNFLKSVLPE